MSTLQPKRRTVAKGALWGAPVIMIGGVAPAYAASECTEPSVTYQDFTCDFNDDDGAFVNVRLSVSADGPGVLTLHAPSECWSSPDGEATFAAGASQDVTVKISEPAWSCGDWTYDWTRTDCGGSGSGSLGDLGIFCVS